MRRQRTLLDLELLFAAQEHADYCRDRVRWQQQVREVERRRSRILRALLRAKR